MNEECQACKIIKLTILFALTGYAAYLIIKTKDDNNE